MYYKTTSLYGAEVTCGIYMCGAKFQCEDISLQVLIITVEFTSSVLEAVLGVLRKSGATSERLLRRRSIAWSAFRFDLTLVRSVTMNVIEK